MEGLIFGILRYFSYLACLSVLVYFFVLAYFSYLACLIVFSLPADVLWGSFVTHSFLRHGRLLNTTLRGRRLKGKGKGGIWARPNSLPLPFRTPATRATVPRNTAARKIGNGVISLLRQLRCPSKPDHNKFSSLSNTTVVAIFPNLCSWRRSLYSNLGGNDPEKLYRATLSIDWSSIGFDYRTFD